MVRACFALIFLGLSGVSGWLYYAQYFKWRDCFNAQGRCYDAASGVVYLEQSGGVWMALSLLALLLALFLIGQQR